MIKLFTVGTALSPYKLSQRLQTKLKIFDPEKVDLVNLQKMAASVTPTQYRSVDALKEHNRLKDEDSRTRIEGGQAHKEKAPPHY